MFITSIMDIMVKENKTSSIFYNINKIITILQKYNYEVIVIIIICFVLLTF